MANRPGALLRRRTCWLSVASGLLVVGFQGSGWAQPCPCPPPLGQGESECQCESPATAGGPASASEGSGAAEASAERGGLTEAQVRALLDDWLAAQNRGDFGAYSSTYADRFFGIRRSGPITRQFDREGWLSDRRRMFRRAMVVTVDDIDIRVRDRTADVRFTQTWESGSYRDVGPKALLVVRQGELARIAREEMLSSTIEDSGGELEPLDPTQFAMVLAGGYLVLRHEPDDAWFQDTYEDAGGDYYGALAPVIGERLPPELAALEGHRFRVFGADESCEATVDELLGLVRVEPHWVDYETWRGNPDFGDGEAWSSSAIARAVWEMGEPLLVGRLAFSGRGCDGIWARSAALPAPTVYSEAEVGAPLRARLARAFRDLEGVAAIQAYYEEDFGDSGPWYPDADLEVHRFTNADTGRTFASVRVSEGMGCGQFYGGFHAIFELTGDGDEAELVLFTDPRSPGQSDSLVFGVFAPTAIFDLDADGRPELTDGRLFLRFVGATLRLTQDVSPRYLDCPC